MKRAPDEKRFVFRPGHLAHDLHSAHASSSDGRWVRGTMMCLGIPGKVVEVYREHDVLMGKVDFSGVCKRVCLEHVAEVQPGEYVLVHVGFALSRLDEEEARRVFEFLAAMDQLDELKAPSHEVR